MLSFKASRGRSNERINFAAFHKYRFGVYEFQLMARIPHAAETPRLETRSCKTGSSVQHFRIVEPVFEIGFRKMCAALPASPVMMAI